MDTSAVARHDALFGLQQAYLFMLQWGKPFYKRLDPKDRKTFTEIVKRDAIFEFVESLKENLVRVMPEVPDSWILPCCVIDSNKPIPNDLREELRTILGQMAPVMIRCRAAVTASQLATPPNGAIAGTRPAYNRDHLWLQWNDEGMKPAAIRDKWNGLSDDERKTICPGCSRGNVTTINVNTALTTSRTEDGREIGEPVAKRTKVNILRR